MRIIYCALSLLLITITPGHSVPLEFDLQATVENRQEDCTCCPVIASVCPCRFLRSKRPAAIPDPTKQVNEIGSGKIRLEEEEERGGRISDTGLIGGGPPKEKAMV